MNKMTTLTFYHYDEVSETWNKRIFNKATVYRVSGISDEKAGRKRDDIAKIRIFSNLKSIEVYVGDYVFFGAGTENQPDKNKCLCVSAVCDRQIGTKPHWRIEAK